MLRWSAAPPDGEPKGHLHRRAIVWRCIKLFYVPHEFTGSLRLAGLEAENRSCALWREERQFKLSALQMSRCQKSCPGLSRIDNTVRFQRNTLLNNQRGKHRRHHEKGKQT